MIICFVCKQLHLDLDRSKVLLCSQGAEFATDCNQCERAKAPWDLEGVKLTLNSKDDLQPRIGGDYPHLDLNRSKVLLCSQGAEFATDCNQCERAKAPWDLEGVKLTLNSKDDLQPRIGGDYPHLDYNYSKGNAKSLFFLRFLCFFIYITHEKR